MRHIDLYIPNATGVKDTLVQIGDIVGSHEISENETGLGESRWAVSGITKNRVTLLLAIHLRGDPERKIISHETLRLNYVHILSSIYLSHFVKVMVESFRIEMFR